MNFFTIFFFFLDVPVNAALLNIKHLTEAKLLKSVYIPISVSNLGCLEGSMMVNMLPYMAAPYVGRLICGLLW